MTHLNTIVSFAIEANAEFRYMNGIFSIRKGNQRFDIQEKESGVYLVTTQNIKTGNWCESIETLPGLMDWLQRLMWR